MKVFIVQYFFLIYFFHKLSALHIPGSDPRFIPKPEKPILPSQVQPIDELSIKYSESIFYNQNYLKNSGLDMRYPYHTDPLFNELDGISIVELARLFNMMNLLRFLENEKHILVEKERIIYTNRHLFPDSFIHDSSFPYAHDIYSGGLLDDWEWDLTN